MKDAFTNFALYQTGWFIMVLCAAGGRPWTGSAGGLALLGCHLLLARDRRAELLTVMSVGALGTAVDSIQAFAGVFVFESGYWTYWAVPFWLTVMWMQFATLFHFSLRWLSGRYLLCAAFGAAGGPAAYLTGERLGGVIFPMGSRYSLLILAGVWTVMLPLCVYAAGRLAPRPGRAGYRLWNI